MKISKISEKEHTFTQTIFLASFIICAILALSLFFRESSSGMGYYSDLTPNLAGCMSLMALATVSFFGLLVEELHLKIKKIQIAIAKKTTHLSKKQKKNKRR